MATMFAPDRDQLRQAFYDAWAKARRGAVLSPLEQQIAEVIRDHPEYHRLFENPEDGLERDFQPEDGTENPFLHLSMHIALREQVGTDRPAGIRAIHHRLSRRLGGHLAAEHRMMECLGRVLWESQRQGRQPDETAYLDCLRRLPR